VCSLSSLSYYIWLVLFLHDVPCGLGPLPIPLLPYFFLLLLSISSTHKSSPYQQPADQEVASRLLNLLVGLSWSPHLRVSLSLHPYPSSQPQAT
jgi:hypothetical protein